VHPKKMIDYNFYWPTMCYNSKQYMYADNTANAMEAKRRWVILGVAFLSCLAYAITMQSVPPILSLVMAEFNLSYAQGGLLMSLFALPGIAISIPAGMLADRYGQKTIGIICFALMIAGAALFASGNSLPILALGRVVAGAGAIPFLVLAPQLLAQWFKGREVGVAMGVVNTAVPLGIILSLNFLSILGGNMGWRASVWISAAVPLLALLVFIFLFAPAPGSIQRIRPKGESFLKNIRLTGISVWILGIAWLLFNAAVISMFTFTPEFLQGSGLTIASAGFVTSAAMWPSIVLNPVVGYVIDKIDHKRDIIAIGGLALAIFIVMIPTATSWILALMIIVGIGMVLIPGPLYTLIAEVVSPERLGLGFGIFNTCLNLGVVAGPIAVGVVRDVTGSYKVSYALMTGFAFLIILAIITLRWRQKHSFNNPKILHSSNPDSHI
jgi:predicted MFS family arabinose efflux permease